MPPFLLGIVYAAAPALLFSGQFRGALSGQRGGGSCHKEQARVNTALTGASSPVCLSLHLRLRNSSLTGMRSPKAWVLEKSDSEKQAQMSSDTSKANRRGTGWWEGVRERGRKKSITRKQERPGREAEESERRSRSLRYPTERLFIRFKQ